MTAKDFDLTSLRLFVETCELGNIAGAAKHSHMVNSAVSKRMAQLERQCGSRLLERRRYGVRPTAAGETLLGYAREILATTQRMEQAMSGHASGVKGQVRLLANASVMAEALADDIVAFMQVPEHAGIRIDIEERLSPSVIQGVKNGAAAIGIVWERADLQGLESRPYRTDHLGVVVPANHPLASHRSLAFADTLEWDHVGLPETSAIQRLFEQTALANGKRLRSKVMVAGFEAAMRVARAQLAICVVPRELIGAGFSAMGLVHIPLTDAWALRRFVLCFRDEAQLPTPSRTLLAHLRRCGSRQVAMPSYIAPGN